jgi:hypothetical protein
MDWKALLVGLGPSVGSVVGGLVMGPAGAPVGAMFGKAVLDHLGITEDQLPSVAPAVLADAVEKVSNDPAIVSKAVDLANAELAILQARLADVQDARSTNLKLVEQGSAISWGAPIVSVVVMVTFGFVMWISITDGVPKGNEAVMLGLVETLKTLATAVVFYWVGSSQGSSGKDRILGQIATGRDSIGSAAGKVVDAVVKGARK